MSEPSEAIPSRASVGRWSVDRYIRLLRPWIVIAGLSVILIVLFRLPQLVIIAFQLVTCAWVGRLVTGRGGQRVEALTAGAMAGLSLGLMTSLSRFVLAPSGYWFINILFETLLLGFVGAMVSAGTHSLLNRKKLSTYK